MPVVCRSRVKLDFTGIVTRMALLSVLLVAVGGSSSAVASTTARSTGPAVQVVAAENFWGSIALQLAGSKASVQSIVVNPNTDPALL